MPASGSPRLGRAVRQSFAAMTRQERRRVIAMYGVIAGLHVLGFFILFAFVVPSHYKGLGIGVSILAYTLGLRHAFDADHISAIDNSTRKVLGERRGHRSAAPVRVRVLLLPRALHRRGRDRGRHRRRREDGLPRSVRRAARGLSSSAGVFGTVVSATFLLLIGLLNLVILAGIARVFRLDAPRRVRRGRAGAAAGQPRVLLPVLRPLDGGHHQGVAAVPGRSRVRPGLRHRHRGRRCWPPPRCWPPSTSPGTRSSACRSCSPRA